MDDRQNRISNLRAEAEKGDIEAQVALGTMLAAGEEGVKGQEEALAWLRRAADSGDITAMFNLGIMHEKGLGTPEDDGEAACWFWQAAILGDTEARMKLGRMLIKGRGFGKNSDVLHAVEASAGKGLPYAQSFLAKLYLDGVGLDRDDASAERFFRLAAEQGEESAIYNLGEMMVEERTSETSEEEVAQWFFDLGRSYLENGDLVKAFDCLVSIKRVDPGHFLAQRLEEEVEKANQDRLRCE